MRVLTNATTLQMAAETAGSPGVLPGSPQWKLLEPNSIGKFGAMLKKIARLPISKNRQPRKPALTDLDSSVEFDCDITYDHLRAFADALFFSVFKGGAVFQPTGITATGYTVPAGGALPNGYLVFVRGAQTAGNNGLKLLAGTSTAIEIKTTGLAVEAIAVVGSVQVEVCGVRGAAGDIQINAGGNLTATILDLSTLGLTKGQFIWVGGDLTNAALSFATAADRGLARVKTIAAALVTVDKKSTVWVADVGAAKTIDIYFGQFLRVVATDSTDYLEKSFQFELAYKNLQNPGPGDEYEYATGNFVNEIAFDMPLTNKGTMKCNFVGLTCGNPTTARATNAGTPVPPIATFPLNTSSDLNRLRITNVDETGVSTDFKSLNMSIKNQCAAEKVLGTLGGKYMNAGLFEVDITAQLLFTDDTVIKAMRDNRQVTMEVGARNDDGGFIIDLPAMTIEGGDKDFPMNQTVTVNMKASGYQDAVIGTTMSLTIFPYLPSA